MKKGKRKRAIAESRAMPEIFVKVDSKSIVGHIAQFGHWPHYAKAKIRVRAGEYQYLQWREAGRVRSLYLGRKRKS